MEWYSIQNIDTIDSPALLVYKEKMLANIQSALTRMHHQTERIRPHVKTNKTPEVCKAMMEAGITQFKCATIAEAEMLAQLNAPDILLAYQPVGPKIQRWVALQQQYPQSIFACLTDNIVTAKEIAAAHAKANISAQLYIDINNGMNRTGAPVATVPELLLQLLQVNNLTVMGLHVYDGHIRKQSFEERKQESDAAFAPVAAMQRALQEQYQIPLPIVAGGSTTFAAHAQRKNVVCSPGTFIFWDAGYQQLMPEEPFQWAAVLITRVISIIDAQTISTDLGHKSVAAENPFPRVVFLNAADARPVAQSEEHLVLKVADATAYTLGQVLYAIPIHICPTVALYNSLQVVDNNAVTTSWKVIARDRSITI